MNETEVTFLGREKSSAMRYQSALATVIASAKLIERARSGDPSQAIGNARCAAMWLRVAATELEEVVKRQSE
ncbi:hypothetical protein [Paraburkholderia bryophila]|uniref:Uncharacterized protein n=1 Tax=Paraburkholderia bryophila TaxID=420952 RepID=A0A7Y9W4U3_9BURK|nr:hypothetical protein [Paraburkholderia bryophila]NYH13553.1 hypothetical protein [Paraburkholderia bryophila]